MNRIASERNLAYVRRKKLIVGYLLAGFPEKDGFFELLSSCEEAGLDVLEIGYPSKKPTADGEVIRKAHSLVDFSIQQDLKYWENIRRAIHGPIWVMGYQEDLIDPGFYLQLAQHGMVDAFVLPDTAPAHRLALLEELQPLGVDVLGFVDPEMSREEQDACFQTFPLIYQQLYAGPTGMAVETTDYEEILARAKTTDGQFPQVFAGFGIHTVERAVQLLNSGFDGAIVGTAMMTKLQRSPEALISFIKELKEAVKAKERE